MIEVTELIRDFRMLPREAYLARHQYAVFVHQTEQSRGQSFAAALEDVVPNATAISTSPATEIQVASSQTGVLVFPVKSNGAHPGLVRVGRHPSCDIRLPYDKVSKLHANVIWFVEAREWYLEDAGSTNGTFYGGVRLRPHQPVALLSGSGVKFGTAQLTFFTATEFHTYLTGLYGQANSSGLSGAPFGAAGPESPLRTVRA
jgi:hypothetical protein